MTTYLIQQGDAFDQSRPEWLNDPALICVSLEQANQSLPDAAEVICYLSDAGLRSVMRLAIERRWILQILVHPDNAHAQRGLLLESAELAQSSDHTKVVSHPLLLCNGEVVLDRVELGNVVSFTPTPSSAGVFSRCKIAWQRLSTSLKIAPQALSIETANEAKLKVAAIGGCGLLHTQRFGLGAALFNSEQGVCGMLHLFVISPRSLFEILRYLSLDLLFSSVAPISNPSFVGHIRSRALTIKAARPLSVCVDDRATTVDEVTLAVSEKTVALRVPKESNLLDQPVGNKEIRKLQKVPHGEEAVAEMAYRHLPWMAHAATEEFRDLYQQLRENARLTNTFIIFMILSTCLATLGLVANSSPVIIGAMLIAPLMDPIVSLAMAMARQDETLLWPSIKKLSLGFLMALLFACSLVMLLPLEWVTEEIAARTRPNLLDLGVAMISGVAGAYAHARVAAARGLAGVAIAVALVPPIAVMGIGFGWLSLSIVSGAFLLFVTNLAGIIFAGATTFLVLGFAPFRRAHRGLLKSFMSVLVVSIPLSFSFYQLVKRADLREQLLLLSLNDASIKQVEILSLVKPVELKIEVVSSGMMTASQLSEIKIAVEAQLDQPVVLQVRSVVRY